MDYFSHQVARKWYMLNHVILLGVAYIILLLFGAAQFLPGLEAQTTAHGLTLATAVITGVYAVYSTIALAFRRIANWPLVVFIGSMMFVLVSLVAFVETNLSLQAVPFIIVWGLTAFLFGMFSLPLQIGSILVTALAVFEQCRFQLSQLGTGASIYVGVELIAVATGYLFWRTRFIDVEAQQLSKLSGIVRSNQQQATILLESLADGVIVTDTEGKISLINPAAAAMTEWPLSEATGIDVRLVVKLTQEKGEPVPEEANPFKLTLTQKKQSTQTLQLKGRNGKQMTISLVVSPVVPTGTTDVTGAVAVMRDISEEHAAEQQRAEFISTASHEMRTPVAAIEGYLALALNDKVASVDARAHSYLEKAHASTQHLGKLFQDLLTSAKAEDGRLSSHPVVVEMGTWLQQAVDDLSFSAKKKGLGTEFIVGSPETIDARTETNGAASEHVLKPLYYVLADPDRMREVLTNLFDNAVKYTDEGKISIGLTGNQEVVQFYIRDSGPGIPAEDIPHLFQKFYRVDNSATRTIGGTGLGLFICRKIVELYKGRIWVDSKIGQGSTFFINLPRIDSQKASQLEANQATQAGSTLPNITSLASS